MPRGHDGCIRFVDDIGLWAFSRGRPTCHWATSWCLRNCYNHKFYRVNPLLPDRDAKDEDYWDCSPTLIAEHIKALPGITRFRFSVRGEIWANSEDVEKVAEIVRQCPEILFWIPTRAWRSADMARHIKVWLLKDAPNARVMASVDPSVSEFTEEELVKRGWSIVFAGENDPDQMRLSEAQCVESRTQGRLRCPKTWSAEGGNCAVCQDGCFSKDRVDVHLRQHR